MPSPLAGSSDPSLAPIPRLSARTVTYLCGLFFLSRLLVLSVAALSHLVLAQGPNSQAAHTWVDRFFVWDAGWYAEIAKHGYYYRANGESSVGFYPLYPLLIRAASFCGMDMRLAGYGISLAALSGACVLLWKLAALETRSERIADRSVLLLLFCPGSIWFGMVYTESLFLLTLLGALLCARQGRWIAAGVWGLVCALTRTPGLLLAGFLVVEGLQQGWERRSGAVEDVDPTSSSTTRVLTRHGADGPAQPGARRATPWLQRVAIGAAGPLIGHASYLAFLQVRFGDWRAQQKTMAAGWNGGSGLTLPWRAVALQWQLVDRYLTALSMPLLAITLLLALAGLFTLRRVSYAVLVWTLCILYVSATPGDAITRYLSTAAPVYIVLAQLAERSRLLETAALVFSVAMMVLVTVFLINGYHVV